MIGEAKKDVLKTRNEKRETRNEKRETRKRTGNLLICQAFLMMTALFLSTSQLHASIGDMSYSPGMPNPAAVYCDVMGGNTLIYDTPAGEVGLCVFPDMTVCDAWDFVGGTCGEQHSICAYYGLDEITLRGGRFSHYSNYCVGDDGIMGDVFAMIDFNDEPICLAMGGGAPSSSDVSESDVPDKTKDDFPDIELEPEFSWRNFRGKNWLTPVKNQRSCGSCWAYSAMGTLEAHYNIFSDIYGPEGATPDMSEEYFVSDCCLTCGDCCGGWPDLVFDQTIAVGGAPDESCMPYATEAYMQGEYKCGCNYDASVWNCTADCPGYRPPVENEQGNLVKQGWCAHTTCDEDYFCGGNPDMLHPISRYYKIENDIETIKLALRTRGPLSVCYTTRGDYTISDGKYLMCSEITLDLNKEPKHTYCWDKNGSGDCDEDEPNEHGVCTVDSCPFTHCVVLTGYTEDAWEIKNSWGINPSTPSDQGYQYIGFNECRIQDHVHALEVDGFDYDSLLEEEEEVDLSGISVSEWVTIGDRTSVTIAAPLGGTNFTLGRDARFTGDIAMRNLVTLLDRSRVYGDVTAGQPVVFRPEARIWGTTTITPPTPYTPPAIPPFQSGTNTITVQCDRTLPLAPGNYGVLDLKARSRVILATGTYTFKEIRLATESTLSTQTNDAVVDIFVEQSISVGDRVKISYMQSPSVTIFALVSQLRFGLENNVWANIIAPQALVTIRDRSRFTGNVRAHQLSIGVDAYIADQ